MEKLAFAVLFAALLIPCLAKPENDVEFRGLSVGQVLLAPVGERVLLVGSIADFEDMNIGSVVDVDVYEFFPRCWVRFGSKLKVIEFSQDNGRVILENWTERRMDRNCGIGDKFVYQASRLVDELEKEEKLQELVNEIMGSIGFIGWHVNYFRKVVDSEQYMPRTVGKISINDHVFSTVSLSVQTVGSSRRWSRSCRITGGRTPFKVLGFSRDEQTALAKFKGFAWSMPRDMRSPNDCTLGTMFLIDPSVLRIVEE